MDIAGSHFTFFFHCNSMRRYLPSGCANPIPIASILTHDNLVGGGLLLLVVPDVDVPLGVVCTSASQYIVSPFQVRVYSTHMSLGR